MDFKFSLYRVSSAFLFILLLFLIPGKLYADQGFFEFSQLEPTGDIATEYSELGKSYVKIVMHHSEKADQLNYQLYYKEYDAGKEFIQGDKTNKQNFSVFHFSLDTMHYYEFCIVAFDAYGDIIFRSPVAEVMPGEFIDAKPSSKASSAKEKSSHAAIQSSGLDANIELSHKHSFPFININAGIKLDGKPFDGGEDNFPVLLQSDFEILEDGRLQRIRQFLSPVETESSSKIADIVFVHDDSGSLNDEAAQVKANIQSFAQQLNNTAIDYRLGLLPYGGGGGFSNPSGTVLNNGILYDDTVPFLSDLNNMRFDGGTEQAFCAMEKAVQQIVWRQSTQKILILITDEDNDSGCINQSELTTLLQNEGVRVYALTRNNSPEFTEIAQATNGKRFNILDDFNTILEEIGKDIAQKYFIQYETDNKNKDNQERTVELTVNVQDNEGTPYSRTVSTTYTPVSPVKITLTPQTEQLSNSGQRMESALDIVAKITEDGGSFGGQATLFYKHSSWSSYSPVAMSSIGNDMFSGQIPANDVNDPAVSYYVEAQGENSTTTLPSVDPGANPNIISVLPNSAPIISHTPVTSVQEGQPVDVRAKVEDATNRVDKVILYYRPVGAVLWNSLEDTPAISEVQYAGTIPGSAVTAQDMEYYIYAEDNFGASSTYGSADNPLEVIVTSQNAAKEQKTIGQLTVYADSITQVQDKIWIASGGDVMIGKVGGEKILSIDTSLRMIYDTDKEITGIVEGLSQANITALDIKRDGSPENIPIYSGDFEIDCTRNSPLMKVQGGESKLRLLGKLPFLFPEVDSTIEIRADAIQLHDLRAHITQGMNILLSIGDIVLSQSEGGSSGEFTLSSKDILTQELIKIAGSNWKLSNFEITIDLIKEKFVVEAGVNIPGLFGSAGDGVGATLGFMTDPWALDTVGGKISYEKGINVPPTGAVAAKLNSGRFLIDNISQGKSGLQLTGSVGAALVDAPPASPIYRSVKKITRYEPITGELALLIDLSGKAKLSGNIQLLEHLTLASGEMGVGGMEAYVKGSLNILDTLLGDLYLGISGTPVDDPQNLTFNGQNSLTLQVPTSTPWIGGRRLTEQSFDANLRFSRSNGLEYAVFKTTYGLWFADLTITLDVSDPTNPDLFVSGLGKTIQVFSVQASKDRRASVLSLKDVTIDKEYDFVMVKVTSSNDTPIFNITFPDNTKYTPSDVEPTGLPEENGQLVNSDIFWIQNTGAHEAYYCLKKPPIGNYQLEITNDADIGNYTVEVFGPNATPEITLQTPGTDMVWDGSSAISIAWEAFDADDNADIDLFIDSDNSGNDGQLIKTGLKEEGESSFDWQVSSNIQSGEYYVYARIDDGENAPVFDYSAGKIEIENPNAPSAPQNVGIEEIDGGLKIDWDAVTDQSVTGYIVHLSDTPGNGNFEYQFGAGDSTSYKIEGLVNNNTYEVAVSSKDDSGLRSKKSDAITGAPNGSGVGGSPDLTVDMANSAVTSASGKLEDQMTVTVGIKNVGMHDAYSARVNCYYGKMSNSHLLGSKLIGQVSAEDSVDVEFQYDASQIPDKLSGRNIYVRIFDVNLPELETSNNIGVFQNTLPFDSTIDLDAGWNLMSFEPKSSDNEVLSLLSPIQGQYESLWGFENNQWRVFDPQNPDSSSLNHLNPGNGYWINATTDSSLTISGTIPSGTVDLVHGWNLVGYNSKTPMSVEDALSSIDGLYVSVWSYENGVWKLYDPANPWFSDLNQLKPGQGYWIATTKACEWTLP